jgi:hypothetical protein
MFAVLLVYFFGLFVSHDTEAFSLVDKGYYAIGRRAIISRQANGEYHG